MRGCRVTGVDINEHGIYTGEQLAAKRSLSSRVSFHKIDAAKPLPFAAATFDAVISNDAMCHIVNRLDVGVMLRGPRYRALAKRYRRYK